MQINGGIRFCEQGLKTSIRAMHVQSEIIGMINENITGFDKIGFQRREPVVSSFTEYLGIHGLSSVVDDEIGRITKSNNPLDLSLANKGYFQIQTPNGIQLTRDGRFKLNKFGELVNLEDNKVLSDSGIPIKLPFLPENESDVIINSKGKITLYDKTNGNVIDGGVIGVVDTNGLNIINPELKQGYNEHSNVNLHKEFLSIKPTIRNFEANRQIFLMESTNLQKVINQLGSSS